MSKLLFFIALVAATYYNIADNVAFWDMMDKMTDISDSTRYKFLFVNQVGIRYTQSEPGKKLTFEEARHYCHKAGLKLADIGNDTTRFVLMRLVTEPSWVYAREYDVRNYLPDAQEMGFFIDPYGSNILPDYNGDTLRAFVCQTREDYRRPK